MFEALLNAFRAPDIRRRIVFVLGMLAIYRALAVVPVPAVDTAAVSDLIQSQTFLQLLDLFSGGGLATFSIVAMGVNPYINASIIMQLMTGVVPRLQALSREGEYGRTKINQYTRYLTVPLALLQAYGYLAILASQGIVDDFDILSLTTISQMITLAAGTVLAMWIGELITERGIGNGISFIIFAGIVAKLPQGIATFFANPNIATGFALVILAIVVVASIVFIQEGQRRIPIQYAKRMVGRRLTTGGSTYLPLRVNMAGVIPIIFAAAVMAFPPTIASFFPATQSFINNHFQYGSIQYLGIEAFLIVIFTYFYTAVQFNPVDQADNLRKYGGYIPGIRPGPPTAQYLDRVLSRLTLPGSIYLALVAVLPGIFIYYFHFSNATSRALGGTSVIIVVGVALDTMRQMESQMMMRSYEGFLK